MQYQEQFQEVSGSIEESDLPDETKRIIQDSLEALSGETGELTVEAFDAGDQVDGTVIPEDVQVADLKSGGSYSTSGADILVTVSTSDPVTVNGVVVPGGSVAVIGGGGDDEISIVSAPAPQGGVARLSSEGADAGTALVAGGAGDDSVSGGEGGDSLSGGAGDDSLSGGSGDDSLEGGVGSDTLDGGEGFDMAMIGDGDRRDFSVSVEGGGLFVTSQEGGVTDELMGVEYIAFRDGEVALALENAEQGAVARIYETLLDRAADAGGLDFWLGVAEEGASVAEVARQFLASDEFAASVDGALSDEAFVDLLYERGLDREADDAGREFWTGVLEGSAGGAGLSRAEVAAVFAASEEAEDTFEYINIISDTDLA